MSHQVSDSHAVRVGRACALILCVGLCTVAILTRIYIKLGIKKRFLSEDYFSIAGYLGFLAYLGLLVVIGKSTESVQHKSFLSTIEKLVYLPVIVFVKTSILLQYVTIFVVIRRNLFHLGIHFLIWINVVFYIIMAFLYLFECTPRRKLWIPDARGHCHYTFHGSIYSGSFNVVSDFVILILPLPILLRLQMPANKKFRVLFVFSFGLLGCIASIIRLVYSSQLRGSWASPTYQLRVDKEGIWASVEIAVGIIVGCMPHIHKLIKRLSSKPPSESRFKVLRDSRVGLSWRRVFSKSSTQEADISPRFGGGNASAPHIETLKITRASFSSTDRELLKLPPPAHGKAPSARSSISRCSLEEQPPQEQTADVESAMPGLQNVGTASGGSRIPAFAHSWTDYARMPENRNNETRRAQYDL